MRKRDMLGEDLEPTVGKYKLIHDHTVEMLGVIQRTVSEKVFNSIIPMQDVLADELDRQLFSGTEEGLSVLRRPRGYVSVNQR